MGAKASKQRRKKTRPSLATQGSSDTTGLLINEAGESLLVEEVDDTDSKTRKMEHSIQSKSIMCFFNKRYGVKGYPVPPKSLELSSNGVAKQKHPDLMGSYVMHENGNGDGYPLYKQENGIGRIEIDIFLGIWFISRVDRYGQWAMWNDKLPVPSSPPETGWRGWTGFFGIDPTTRLRSMEENVDPEPQFDVIVKVAAACISQMPAIKSETRAELEKLEDELQGGFLDRSRRKTYHEATCLMALNLLLPRFETALQECTDIPLNKFKTYQDILDYIEDFINSGSSKEFNRATIYILGTTGSGKTSLALTLQQFIQNPNKNPCSQTKNDKKLLETQVLQIYGDIKNDSIHKKIPSVTLESVDSNTTLINFGQAKECNDGKFNLSVFDFGGHTEYFSSSQLISGSSGTFLVCFEITGHMKLKEDVKRKYYSTLGTYIELIHQKSLKTKMKPKICLVATKCDTPTNDSKEVLEDILLSVKEHLKLMDSGESEVFLVNEVLETSTSEEQAQKSMEQLYSRIAAILNCQDLQPKQDIPHSWFTLLSGLRKLESPQVDLNEAKREFDKISPKVNEHTDILGEDYLNLSKLKHVVKFMGENEHVQSSREEVIVKITTILNNKLFQEKEDNIQIEVIYSRLKSIKKVLTEAGSEINHDTLPQDWSETQIKFGHDYCLNLDEHSFIDIKVSGLMNILEEEDLNINLLIKEVDFVYDYLYYAKPAIKPAFENELVYPIELNDTAIEQDILNVDQSQTASSLLKNLHLEHSNSPSNSDAIQESKYEVVEGSDNDRNVLLILEVLSALGEILFFGDILIPKPMDLVKSLRSILNHNHIQNIAKKDLSMIKIVKDLMNTGVLSDSDFRTIYDASKEKPPFSERQIWNFLLNLDLACSLGNLKNNEMILIPCLIQNKNEKLFLENERKMIEEKHSICLQYMFPNNKNSLGLYNTILKHFTQDFQYRNMSVQIHRAFSQKIEEKRLGSVGGIEGSLNNEFDFALIEYETDVSPMYESETEPESELVPIVPRHRGIRFHIKSKHGPINQNGAKEILNKFDKIIYKIANGSLFTRDLMCKSCLLAKKSGSFGMTDKMTQIPNEDGTCTECDKPFKYSFNHDDDAAIALLSHEQVNNVTQQIIKIENLTVHGNLMLNARHLKVHLDKLGIKPEDESTFLRLIPSDGGEVDIDQKLTRLRNLQKDQVAFKLLQIATITRATALLHYSGSNGGPWHGTAFLATLDSTLNFSGIVLFSAGHNFENGGVLLSDYSHFNFYFNNVSGHQNEASAIAAGDNDYIHLNLEEDLINKYDCSMVIAYKGKHFIRDRNCSLRQKKLTGDEARLDYFALIIHDQDIQEKFKNLGLQFLPCASPPQLPASRGHPVLIFGHPANPECTCASGNCSCTHPLRLSYGEEISASNHRIKYNLDTLGGNSGSPVTGKFYTVKGIHVAAGQNTESNKAQTMESVLESLRKISILPSPTL